MALDKVPNMSLPDQESDFWNQYYPKVLAISQQCCPNFTVDSAAMPAIPRPSTSVAFLLLPFVATLSSSLL
jgi:hypothetical protein